MANHIARSPTGQAFSAPQRGQRNPAGQEFLAKDPARNVKAPENLRDTDKTTLGWEQLRAALATLSLKERLILELYTTNALRPEELFCLRWRCFNYSEKSSGLELRETVYRGEIRPWGKTKCSLRTIPIPRKLAR